MIRHWRLSVAAALTVPLVLAGCTTIRHALPGGNATEKFDPHALALADPSVIGMSQTNLDARFALIDQSHAAGLRTDVFWRIVERQPGKFDWSLPDTVVNAAKQHDKIMLLPLDYAPQWGAHKDCTDSIRQRCAPNSVARYSNFAGKAAAHYGALGQHYYELWNEPNRARWWGPAPSAADFAALIDSACQAIKAADKDAYVITGGLALGNTPGDIGMATFAKQFYQAGPGKCFDAVGVHLFGAAAIAQASQVHDEMVKHGDGNKQIWATEAGSTASGTCGSRDASEIHQGQTVDNFVHQWRALPWGGPMFWFLPQAGDRIGLLCANGSRTLAFSRFQELAR